MTLRDNEEDFDFLKTIYQARLDDRKYFEDKAQTLIQTNSILIIILSGILTAILPTAITITPLLLLGILFVISLYLVSALCALYIIFPRRLEKLNIKPSKTGIRRIDDLADLKNAYEQIVLPHKAKWIKIGLLSFTAGLVILVVILSVIMLTITTFS